MLTLLLSCRLLAQGLDPATIANPPADSWPSYHGDYSGRRHSPLTQITPQNVSVADPGLGVPDGTAGGPEVLAPSGQRHSVLHRAGQRLGSGCALRTSDLALHLSAQQGPPHRTSRRCHVQGLVVFHYSGCPPHFSGRQERQSPLEHPDRRCRKGLLVHHVSAGGPRSRDRRRFR